MLIRWTILGVLLLASIVLRARDVLDRIVATVNGHVILQSDWDEELRFECFMSGHTLPDISVDQRKAALDRLIDQEVLREQMRVMDSKPAAAEQIEKQMYALKTDQLRQHTGGSWQTALSLYQLTDKIIENHVTAELEQFQLIDTRFRPSIQVSAAEIEKYYREQLVPKLPPSDPVSLADASPKIREILVQQKMNQLLNSWLEMLRSQAQIRITSANFSTDGGRSQGEPR
jgi:peptidyl-prolyl cis-trans isomerase SurA